MSQQKTRSTRTKFTSMGRVTTSKGSSALYSTGSPCILNAHRPHASFYSHFNRRSEANEKLPSVPKSRESTSISGRHQERIRPANVVEFVQQLPLGAGAAITNSHVYPIANTNNHDYQPFVSFHPYSYFDHTSRFVPSAERMPNHMQEYYMGQAPVQQKNTNAGSRHPHNGSAYRNTHRPDEVFQVPTRSRPTKEIKARVSNRYDAKVDHTYRDFSGVSPSTEDLKRYENKIEEYTRRKNKVKEDSTSSKDASTASSHRRARKADALVTRRGRGNRASQDGENAFVGFMGTNFPARLHDLLSHEDDVGDIITWLPHGRSWIVRDKTAFLEKVAPTHFQISKFESFTRQVNGWGFKRITQGPDINSYYHELFLRGMPHLIQWMKRVSSTGTGKRRLRADPSEEPNFYDISQKYPIPDYYHQNNGQPLLSLPADSSCNEHLGKDKESSKQLLSINSICEPVRSEKNADDCKQQQEEEQLNDVSAASEFTCSTSSISMVIKNPKQQNDSTDYDDHVLHEHYAFYQMPMLSPACLLSPKISDQHPNIKNSNSLQDVTSEEFWVSDTVSHLDPRPILRTKVNREGDGDLYDVIIAPAVSYEESSESCAQDLLPTSNQWQSICDLLLEEEDLDIDHEMHTNGTCKNANSQSSSKKEDSAQVRAFATNMTVGTENRTDSKESPPFNPDKTCDLSLYLEYSAFPENFSQQRLNASGRDLECSRCEFPYEDNSWEELNHKNPSTIVVNDKVKGFNVLANFDLHGKQETYHQTLQEISTQEPLIKANSKIRNGESSPRSSKECHHKNTADKNGEYYRPYVISPPSQQHQTTPELNLKTTTDHQASMVMFV